jgi:hypothetical protein
MSDYLNNLVARHLNLIEVIQPRLASRFEPPSIASPLGANLSGSLEDQETLEAETSVESDRQRATVRAAESPSLALPPSQHSLMPEPLASDEFSSGPPENLTRVRSASLLPAEDFEQPTSKRPMTASEDRAQPVDQAASSKSTHPTRLDLTASLASSPSSSAQTGDLPPVPPHQAIEAEAGKADRAIRTQASQPQPEREIPSPVARQHEQQARVAASTIISPEERLQENASPRHTLETSSRRPDAAEQRGPDEHAVEREVIERVRTTEQRRPAEPTEIEPHPSQNASPPAPASLIVEPRVTKYTEAEAEARTRHAPEPAPTINVTIGRLEVRAMVAPAPSAVARRQRAATPLTSLDDYLRQRAGGGVR